MMMHTAPRSSRAALWAVIGLASASLVGGCGDKSTDAGGDDVTTIAPSVVFTDAANYQLEAAAIGKADAASEWVYGVIRFKYLGSADLKFVKVTATFQNKKGETLFDDESYIHNPDVCAVSSVTNTSTFLTPTHSTGYYFIIESLGALNLTISDVARVQLAMDGSTFTYAPPNGHLGQQASPYRAEPDAWKLGVRNDGGTAVQAEFGRFVFSDAQGRTAQWRFTDCYVGQTKSSDFAIDDTGTLVAESVTPDYEAGPLGFSAALIDWSLATSGKAVVAGTLPEEGLSTEARAALRRDQSDRLEDARRLLP